MTYKTIFIEDLNIYDENDAALMLEDGMIESFEEGFMRGYMAS
jgi:hypothetical protein